MMTRYAWREVAHTFDGYEAAGSLAACAKVARDVRQRVRDGVPLSEFGTDELRTTLFFEARADRHAGWDSGPSPREFPHEEAIVTELVRRNGEAWLENELEAWRKSRGRL